MWGQAAARPGLLTAHGREQGRAPLPSCGSSAHWSARAAAAAAPGSPQPAAQRERAPAPSPLLLKSLHRAPVRLCARAGWAIQRIRQFYMRKVKYTQQTWHEKLSRILEDFPKARARAGWFLLERSLGSSSSAATSAWFARRALPMGQGGGSTTPPPPCAPPHPAALPR